MLAEGIRGYSGEQQVSAPGAKRGEEALPWPRPWRCGRQFEAGEKYSSLLALASKSALGQDFSEGSCDPALTPFFEDEFFSSASSFFTFKTHPSQQQLDSGRAAQSGRKDRRLCGAARALSADGQGEQLF